MKIASSNIVVAVIGLVGVLGAGLMAHLFQNSQESLRVTVNAIDSVTSKGVPHARVVLRAKDGVNQKLTDDYGTALFRLGGDEAQSPAKVTISDSKFRSATSAFYLPSKGGIAAKEIDLVPLQVQSSNQATAGNGNGVPVSPMTADRAVGSNGPNRFVQITTSPPEISGEGANFSKWYTLCSVAKAPHYKISAVEFTLSGDRRCGAWAQCVLTTRTETKACYEFRMQGHNEVFPPGQALSQGVLKVTFTRAAH